MRVSEPQVRRDSRLFEELCAALLRRGNAVQFRANGQSMSPNLQDGDDVVVAPANASEVRPGDVILTRGRVGLQVHRVESVDSLGQVITRGDSGQENDPPAGHLFGKVIVAERAGKLSAMTGGLARFRHSLRILFHRAKLSAARRLRSISSIRALFVPFILCAMFAGAPSTWAQAALTITNSASPTSVLPGANITYTQVLSNTSGTAVTHPLTVTQNVPANTTYVSAVKASGTANWTCAQAAGVITCTDTSGANYASGSSTTFTVVVTVNAGTAAGTAITDTVNAKGNNTGTASSSATVNVTPADLALTQSVSPSVVAPSTNYAYSEVVINNGPTNAAAGTVTVSTQTPANTNFQTYSGTNWACSTPAVGGTGNILCTYSSALASGGTATTLTLTLQVAAGTASGTVIQNSATVADTLFTDPNPSNNTSTSSITVEPAGTADLQLTQIASPDSVAAGTNYVYTETVVDNGPTAAPNGSISLTTQTPANTTFQAYAGTSWTCTTPAVGATGNIVCTYNTTLAAGATANALTITVGVNAGVASGTVITNSAIVSNSSLTDPIPSNNTSTTNVTVVAAGTADLQLTQSVSSTAVDAGQNYFYTEVVTDNGPTAAGVNTITVYMQTPPNTTYQSFTGTNWTCTAPATGGTGPIICTYGVALASGASASTLLFSMQVNAGTAYGTAILNSTTVTNSTLVDPIPSNNTSVTSILVESVAASDLGLSMSVSPTPVFISTNLTYTLQVQNLGQLSAPATLNILSDTLPANVTFVSVTSSSGWSCTGTTTISCSITSAMPMGATATIAITVTAPATATTLNNSATLSLPGDPNGSNNSASAYTVVQPLVCATPGKDGLGGTITGIVNAYYPPTTASLGAGATSVTLGAAVGASQAINAGDLLLIIQMQDAAINSTNTSSYGSGLPGVGYGSTSLGSSGLFEFVTATNAVPTTGGTLQFTGSGANGGLLNSYVLAAYSATQGQQSYQVIRVPQYTSATLSNGLAPLAWNGSVGGVLAIDVSSQLTLSGKVAADALGFRGGGGRILGGGTGANTDYVTLASDATNASKGEGIAGTPRFLAPATITVTTTATDTTVEGLPNGSYARGGPGNAGGGGTDGNPAANNENSGGGAGANGGAGGYGGYGWNSFTALNTTDGGFGGAAFPASTSALVMGGAGGAGTTNDGSYYISATNHGADCGADCTGIYSSGGAGGGIIIIHAGSVAGSGTITSNGGSTLSTDNDSTGGGGAGGSILVFANSGGLGGLTVSANGGSGGDAWPETAPGSFPGQRHGPGGGGGGGVILLSGSAAASVAGGSNGFTDTVQDSYGATPGQPGVVVTTHVVTETPGTQAGAYCAGADLSVTNSAAPLIVAPGGTITYTQTVTNNGPFDAVNVLFSEGTPANTVFETINTIAGWTCSTPNPGSTGAISCSNPDLANGGSATFTITVQVGNGTASGTQIVDVDNVTSGTNDPNLANNTATAVTTVATATQADLAVTNTVPATVTAGSNFTMTAVVTNNGPATASGLVFNESTASNAAGTINATFVSLVVPSGWSCTTPTSGSAGTINCTATSLVNGGTATFPIVMNVPSGTAAGTVLSGTAYISAATPDPNTGNNYATASTVVANAGQADLAVTSTGSPNPVTPGNNITYTQSITNNGPTAITASATTTVTFTDVLPTINTSPVTSTTLAAAVVAPAGWTCTAPAVGSTGTVTCTLNVGQTLAVGAVVNFPLVVKVPVATPAGSIVTNSPTIASSVTDPYTANNTATVTTVVASPSQADVSIVKTAAPEPVTQGTNLTYTLTVNNAGPAVAQNVVVSDPIPAQVSYTSVSTTMGSCNYSGATNTVSCNLGNLGVGSTAVITINVNAVQFSSTTDSTNTATVSASTSDPNTANNTSSFTSTIQASTAVDISSFNAYSQPDGTVRLVWHTHEESRNLGFHVYREDGSGRHRVDPSLVAGSALLLRGSKPQHAAKIYAALDSQASPNAAYWLEDVDINGTRTLHGPVYVEPASAEQPERLAPAVRAATLPVSPSLSQLYASVSRANAGATANVVYSRQARRFHPGPPSATRPFNAADYPAVKISVDQEGWYHIPFSQLFAAGLGANTDVRSLHLYAEGMEQPILLVGHTSGAASPTDAIEFYGTGIDTAFTADRAYWLVAESATGKRIVSAPAAPSGSSAPASFPFTTSREDRTVYFAALLNGENNDNFFGAAITSDPTDQTLNVVHRDSSSTQPLSLTLTLQGATDAQQHSVAVEFNGTSVGTFNFYGQILATQTFSMDPSQLLDGANTVTLTALNGDNDVSLVQSIQLQYMHTYAADSDWLEAYAPSDADVHISGFSNAQVRVFDITDPLNIYQLNGKVAQESGSYGVTVGLPTASTETRTLLAFAANTLSSPVAIAPHTPTLLDQQRSGADIVMIAYPEFVSHLAPLVQLRESQGHTVSLVSTDQVFDDFNYGERSPFAIRSFLQNAVTNWQRKPQAVLFVGDASMDPRNYLGFGNFDFVPTRIIQTAALKTASDDWFTDFLQNGYATIATGRLPARTTADVDLLVSKIVGYEQGTNAGSWNAQALLVADQNVDANFTSAATSAAAIVPTFLQTSQIFADGADPDTVHSQIMSALNNGAVLVDYNGHGAEQQWSFVDLFDNNDAAALTNGGRLPVYLLIDCLNGLFQDVYAQSLSKALILAPNGGAVAVWASSGFTNEPPQASMNLALLNQLAANPTAPLGVMILGAKNVTTDNDVRRTWILLGDPSLKLQFAPQANPVSASAPASTRTASKRVLNKCPRTISCPKENP